MDTLATIQPIVLVGGQSKRFGRDKLREPNPQREGEFFVDRPIAALREVFGHRVAIVGECHEVIAPRAGLVIADRYPGAGPIGGIVSALQETDGDVFVLAGDLPWITGDVVRRVLHAAEKHGDALAVLACTDRLEPCIGLYRRAALPLLLERLQSTRRALHDALPYDRIATVDIDPHAARNINTPGDLLAQQTGGGP